jgi:hypothetical protein
VSDPQAALSRAQDVLADALDTARKIANNPGAGPQPREVAEAVLEASPLVDEALDGWPEEPDEGRRSHRPVPPEPIRHDEPPMYVPALEGLDRADLKSQADVQDFLENGDADEYYGEVRAGVTLDGLPSGARGGDEARPKVLRAARDDDRDFSGRAVLKNARHAKPWLWLDGFVLPAKASGVSLMVAADDTFTTDCWFKFGDMQGQTGILNDGRAYRTRIGRCRFDSNQRGGSAGDVVQTFGKSRDTNPDYWDVYSLRPADHDPARADRQAGQGRHGALRRARDRQRRPGRAVAVGADGRLQPAQQRVAPLPGADEHEVRLVRQARAGPRAVRPRVRRRRGQRARVQPRGGVQGRQLARRQDHAGAGRVLDVPPGRRQLEPAGVHAAELVPRGGVVRGGGRGDPGLLLLPARRGRPAGVRLGQQALQAAHYARLWRNKGLLVLGATREDGDGGINPTAPVEGVLVEAHQGEIVDDAGKAVQFDPGSGRITSKHQWIRTEQTRDVPESPTGGDHCLIRGVRQARAPAVLARAGRGGARRAGLRAVGRARGVADGRGAGAGGLTAAPFWWHPMRHADTSHGRPPEPAPDPAAADAAAQGGRAARDHLGRGGASRARRVARREDGGMKHLRTARGLRRLAP